MYQISEFSVLKINSCDWRHNIPKGRDRSFVQSMQIGYVSFISWIIRSKISPHDFLMCMMTQNIGHFPTAILRQVDLSKSMDNGSIGYRSKNSKMTWNMFFAARPSRNFHLYDSLILKRKALQQDSTLTLKRPRISRSSDLSNLICRPYKWSTTVYLQAAVWV